MRLPGFTAERNIRRVVPSYSEGGEAAINRLAGSRLIGLGYVCTPDNRACACSGAFDCLACGRDPKACGNKTTCVCHGGAGCVCF